MRGLRCYNKNGNSMKLEVNHKGGKTRPWEADSWTLLSVSTASIPSHSRAAPSQTSQRSSHQHHEQPMTHCGDPRRWKPFLFMTNNCAFSIIQQTLITPRLCARLCSCHCRYSREKTGRALLSCHSQSGQDDFSQRKEECWDATCTMRGS